MFYVKNNTTYHKCVVCGEEGKDTVPLTTTKWGVFSIDYYHTFDATLSCEISVCKHCLDKIQKDTLTAESADE